MIYITIQTPSSFVYGTEKKNHYSSNASYFILSLFFETKEVVPNKITSQTLNLMLQHTLRIHLNDKNIV